MSNKGFFYIVGLLFPDGSIRMIRSAEWPLYAAALNGLESEISCVLREMQFPINDWILHVALVVPDFVDYSQLVPAFEFVFTEFAPMFEGVFLSDINSIFDSDAPF